MYNRILNNYFFILFSLIPASIIAGSAVSVIIVILIDLSFIFLLIYKREYKFLSNKTVKLILFFCLYLVFNSIISNDFSIGAIRNFGFIRFGILFCAFNYFFYDKNFFNKTLSIWSITLFLLTIDVYIESIFGRNIIGYGIEYGERIVSFFKDEPIVGGYLSAFFLIIIGYFYNLNNKISNKYKNIILIISLFFFFAIFLTGERSNAIKALFSLLIFYYFNDLFKLRHKALSVLLLVALFGLILNGSGYLRSRYVGQFLSPVIFLFHSNEEIAKRYPNKTNKDFLNTSYYRLYKSGFTVFKNYPVFGVGNKNFRLEACGQYKKDVEQKGKGIVELSKKENKSQKDIYLLDKLLKNLDTKYVCNTHPHQLYFEFLAEHGLIGSCILLFILFRLIFGKIKIIINSKNYLQIGCLAYLSVMFIPFLPSGSFFSDYSLTLFWINLSIMYSVGKKTNIFLSK